MPIYVMVIGAMQKNALDVTVERPLRLNFQATDERIARLDEQAGYRSRATSNKKNETVRQKEIEAGQARQAAIREMLTAFAGKAGDKLYKDRKAFLTDLKAVDRERGVRLSVSEIKAVLNRHFYRYEPPPLDKIEADTWKLEGEIMEMLAEVAR